MESGRIQQLQISLGVGQWPRLGGGDVRSVLLNRCPNDGDFAVIALSRGKPRVDGRRVVSGITYSARNGYHWEDAPKAYRPHKALYSSIVCWPDMGAFGQIRQILGSEGPMPNRIVVNITHIKVHSNDVSLLKEGECPCVSVGWKAS